MTNPSTHKWESHESNIYNVSYTAIIPALISDKYLQSSITGVFKQRSIENVHYSIIIVVSNCNSTNLKKQLIDFVEKKFFKYDISTTLVIHEELLNGSEARNNCIELSNSNYIGFCDSDDIWNSNKVQKEIELIHKIGSNCKIDFIGSKVIEKDIENIEIQKIPINSNHALWSRSKFPHTSTWVISKKLSEKIKFDEKLTRFQDLAFIIEAKNKGIECIIMNKSLVLFNRKMIKKKIKNQSLELSLYFCRKYLTNNPVSCILFIIKYYLYPRVRYFNIL